CPDGWQCDEVGYPAPPGTQLYDAATQTWTLQGGGFDIFYNTDQFHFVSRPMTGDGALSARAKFVDLPNNPGNDYAKAGVMLRDTTDPGSAYYGAFLTAQHGIMVQFRTVAGDNTGQALLADPVQGPVYLKVVRAGAVYTAYVSTDGAAWQLVDGSAVNV